MDENKSVGARLAQARKAAGYDTAARAAEALGIKYPTYAAHENGTRGIRTSELRLYSRRFDVSLNWLLNGAGNGGPITQPNEPSRQPSFTVPMKGYVGAGQAVYPVEDVDEPIEAPPYSNDQTVAVQVRGDSMFPVYEDGTILFFSRLLPPPEMLNRRCVVRLADGKMLVKTLRRGSLPGHYTLSSFNAPDLEDQLVEWAAPIEWVKPRF